MSNKIERITALLNTMLYPTYLDIQDESHLHQGHKGFMANGSHFFITIQSEMFRGQRLLECHRLVYDALKEMMNHDIHALRMKILFPDV